MRELVLELMGEYGNLAVFLLILVENLFPPIPSEVILTFGGVMTVCTDMTPGSVIFSATVGSLVGAVILYGVEDFCRMRCFESFSAEGPGICSILSRRMWISRKAGSGIVEDQRCSYADWFLSSAA